jgi:hypothetical protein
MQKRGQFICPLGEDPEAVVSATRRCNVVDNTAQPQILKYIGDPAGDLSGLRWRQHLSASLDHKILDRLR